MRRPASSLAEQMVDETRVERDTMGEVTLPITGTVREYLEDLLA